MKVLIGIILGCLLSLTAVAQDSGSATPPQQGQENHVEMSQRGYERIVKEVRHELVMLPFYGVFDNFIWSPLRHH